MDKKLREEASMEENKSHKERDKMVIFWNILDLSSPRQASGSPRPWESFSLKQPTRLSELIPSSLSNWLAWTSFPCRGRVLGVGKLKKERKNTERKK